MKSSFFIGHRDAPNAVLAHLTVTLERLIVEESVGFFYVGQSGSFDRLAGLAVKQLKQALSLHHFDAGVTISSCRSPYSNAPRF